MCSNLHRDVLFLVNYSKAEVFDSYKVESQFKESNVTQQLLEPTN